MNKDVQTARALRTSPVAPPLPEATVALRGNYVRIDLGTGRFVTLEVAHNALRKALRLCGRLSLFRILVEGHRPMSAMTSAELHDLVARLELIEGLKLACCLYDYEQTQLARQFVQLAGEQGTKVRFYDNCEEALEWLGAK